MQILHDVTPESKRVKVKAMRVLRNRSNKDEEYGWVCMPGSSSELEGIQVPIWKHS